MLLQASAMCVFITADVFVTLYVAGQCYVCDGEEVLHFHKINYDLDQGEAFACKGENTETPSSEDSVYYRN